ncbi:sensor histidine kinase [Microbispora sp. ATCC PTA-5024]|uniref:sensor histidine kinase n=1 Tax=Microbispora sp. ATCC PTA-5024 TaxID=316330 RepID=UPI0003DB8FA2|nr:sensor histidine kinase [Microbispora sp. ATCC PTA-5024]ETK36624.1 hypothetical protein MPTA5024_08090 [Microbispora sp. ATCC PTA-5024]
MTEMIHQVSLYGSDEEFLEVAVPFVRDGIDHGEPVLVTTTSANLDLVGGALGADADRVDYAESAYFGRRTAQRATAFLRYWRRNAGRGRVRVLAEPVWPGRSERDVLAWTRMESALNLLLAGTGVWMICPYDLRAVGRDVAEDALRTHPSVSPDGRRAEASPAYADPAAFIGACDAAPLPAPPGDAVTATAEVLPDVRAFVTEEAGRRGVTGEHAVMPALAVHEAARYLGLPVTIRVWETSGGLVWDLSAAGDGGTAGHDPLAGFVPPDAGERADEGLWLARQVCDHVDIRSGRGSRTIRLQAATSRLQESG